MAVDVYSKLTIFDRSVLNSIIGHDDGIPNFNILPYRVGCGKDISRSLQKLKRLGLAEIVMKRRGVARWKAVKV